MSNSDHLLTVAEMATRLNVCQKTIRNWASRGLIPTIRISKTVRFDPTDVIRTLKKRDSEKLAK
jgi:excisionase family DNA binding protein